MKFKMKVPVEENTKFSPNAVVDCIGKDVHQNGLVVGKIIGYEIVQGELVIECETDDPIVQRELERGWYNNGNVSIGQRGGS